MARVLAAMALGTLALLSAYQLAARLTPLPRHVPPYPTAQQLVYARPPDGDTEVWTFLTPDAPGRVVAFYDARLTARGWLGWERRGPCGDLMGGHCYATDVGTYRSHGWSCPAREVTVAARDARTVTVGARELNLPGQPLTRVVVTHSRTPSRFCP